VFRRVLILLLMCLLPFQVVAGSLSPLCRHGAGAQEQQLGAAVSGEHVHCLDAAATGDDGAPGSQTAAADDCCDDCSVCHHVAFSLVFLPLVPDALDFSPVRVAPDLLPGASRVPPQPDRPPRSAAA